MPILDLLRPSTWALRSLRNEYGLHLQPKPQVPATTEGWCAVENYQVMGGLLSEKTKLILEVGSWHGRSARLMLDLAKNATIICVDIWNPDPTKKVPGTEIPTSTDFGSFVASCWAYRDRIIAIPGDSQVVLPELRTRGIRPDIIYIDGSHECPVVDNDIENAILFPGAFVFGDDLAGEFPDVVAAVKDTAEIWGRELTANGRCWSLGRNP